jgi:ATP-binding cassette subfamily B protein
MLNSKMRYAKRRVPESQKTGGVTDYGKFALVSVFYLIFSLSLPASFVKLLYVSQNGMIVLNGIERMDAVLNTPPLPEAAFPKTCAEYTVSFENVNFSYGGAAEAAIRNLSFTAKQSEITALAGPSGGGKSTLAHLIPRFYEVDSGAIKIGGVDIRDMSSEYLLSIVSFVFHDVFLFKQSVMDNILVGNKNAGRSAAIAAAEAAQCGEFVETLPIGP